MVCDLFFAAWVIFDELHSAGSEHTMTYTAIINAFNRYIKNPALCPFFTAITGTAMATGL
jgi:hypothetical protein